MDADRNTDEFIRLFSLHTNSLYSYIHVLVPVHNDAEDIFQETSRTLWEKFGQYQAESDGGFRAWALRIAQIEVLRHRQRDARRYKVFSDRMHEALDAAAMESVASLDPRFEALGDCYQRLPDEDRGLIDARYQIGSTVESIAAKLGRSVHAIYRSLRRIHQVLFECIERSRREGRGKTADLSVMPSEKEQRP